MGPPTRYTLRRITASIIKDLICIPNRGGVLDSGGSRKIWWGGFVAKTSKIRMSSPKLRVIFRPKSEIQTFFSPKIRWSPKKKKKKKKVFTKIETDFLAGFVTFRSMGGDASRNGAELFKIRADFSAKIVTFRLVGGDASRNGAELFKIRADFSAKIVTFRLVGGDASPPLNPPLVIEDTF